MTPTRPLGQTTATGAAWLLLQSGGGRVFSFLCQLVTAALLSPGDYGMIGLAYTAVAVGTLLGGFGLDSVLLQRHRAMRLWLAPAFWFSLGLGLAGMLVTLAIGPVAASIYHVPAVAPLSAVIALSMPITALGTLPTVVLRSRAQFRWIAGIGFAEILLVQLLTIALALTGFGAYSFALPLPVVAVIRTVGVWMLAPVRLHGLFRRLGRVRHLLNSSFAVFATAAVQQAVGQGDYVVLGAMGSEVAVGVYFFAFKMASQPLLMLAASLSSVLFPALAQLRNTRAAQGAAALRAGRLLGLLIMPLACLQASLIAPAIHLFFAAKWNGSIVPMQILSVALGVDAIAWIAGTLVTARGEFWRQFRYITGLAVPFFLLVAVGGWGGSPLSMAGAVGLYYVCFTPAYTYAVFRRSGVTLRDVARLYLVPTLLAAAAMGGAALLVSDAMGEMLQIVIIPVLGLGAYAGLLRLVDPAGYGELRRLGEQMLRGRLRRAGSDAAGYPVANPVELAQRAPP